MRFAVCWSVSLCVFRFACVRIGFGLLLVGLFVFGLSGNGLLSYWLYS